MLFKNNDNNMYCVIQQSDEYGYNYYVFDMNYKEVDGGCVYCTNMDGLSEEEIKQEEENIKWWDSISEETAAYLIMRDFWNNVTHTSKLDDEVMEEKLLENC